MIQLIVRNLFSILLFLLIPFTTVLTQERAITELGDTVYIYPDGTWSYELDLMKKNKSFFEGLDEPLALDTADIEYLMPALNQNKTLVSGNARAKITYNNSVWNRLPPAQINEMAEFALATPQMQSFAMVLTEEVEVGMNNIYTLAMRNVETFVGEAPQIIEEEFRKVNGIYVISVIYRVEFQGYDLTYYSYFHSSQGGTVQFFTWTSTNVFTKKKEMLENVLNGLVLNYTTDED